MQITKAVAADIPELNILVNSAYRGESSKKGWTTEAHLLDGLRIDEATLSHFFENPNITILKNTDAEGRITGCVYLEQRPPKFYVGMFSVSPQLQAGGIGKALLTAAEDFAKEMALHTLTMTVISSRHELISWYERRGFSWTGETQPFHEGTRFGIPREPITLIVMEKMIG